MKTKEIPENIGEFLKYDETSPTCLRWIKRPGKQNIIGFVAGGKTFLGYFRTKFNDSFYLNHRIIFFLHNGFCPNMIDHIDGNRSNNKIHNLRECSISENSCNQKLNKNNNAGHKGVSKKLERGYAYWYVQIRKDKKVYSKRFPLSQFQEACDYADSLRKSLHGGFSNNGKYK